MSDKPVVTIDKRKMVVPLIVFVVMLVVTVMAFTINNNKEKDPDPSHDLDTKGGVSHTNVPSEGASTTTIPYTDEKK